MPLSKSNRLYSTNCLRFFKRAVPLKYQKMIQQLTLFAKNINILVKAFVKFCHKTLNQIG
jgi:hypothetical protein